MKVGWRTGVALILLSVSCALPCDTSANERGATGDVVVGELSTLPNYGSKAGRMTSETLTDGLTVDFPAWTQYGGVVWEDKSPVGIELRIRTGRHRTIPGAGTLKIHTTKASYAGINVPRRIDVYSEVDADQWRHVGGVSTDTGKFLDKASQWISVELGDVGDRLYVVVHADGRYLVIDEIQWSSTVAHSLSADGAAIGKNAIFNDSADRIRQSVIQRAQISTGVDRRGLSTFPEIWVADPWSGNITGKRLTEADQLELCDISGLIGEHQAVLIGISTGENSNRGPLSFEVEGLRREAWTLAEVKEVATANGEVAFDALVPVRGNNRSVPVNSRSSYFWITFDLARVGVGNHVFRLVVAVGDVVRRFDVTANVVNLPATSKARLRAINWAYLTDFPLLENRGAAMTDLEEHGIDVFVANPGVIPGIELNGEWSFSKVRDLTYLANKARQVNGMLLLYLGWRSDRNPLVGGNSSGARNVEVAFRSWLARIASTLDKAGLERTQWALYPVDEPDGEQLKFLGRLKEIVGKDLGRVMIYADPTIADGGKISIADLRRADDVVDVWQPNLGMLNTELGGYFRALDRSWWVYENPAPPAKHSSPFKDYLLLSWRAWSLGATGIGFWSYSDTTGSSAWNDFDGRRADWAVVYESESGPISSRRWEGFRKGLEDYWVLRATSESAKREIADSIETQPFAAWGWRERLDARKKALGAIQ